MKTLGGATLVGVLVALAIIYWLSPLNGGAVALVLILCVSAANLVAAAVVAVRKRAEEPGRPARKKKRGHAPKIFILAVLVAGVARAPQPPKAGKASPPPPTAAEEPPPTAAEEPPPPPP